MMRFENEGRLLIQPAYRGFSWLHDTFSFEQIDYSW